MSRMSHTLVGVPSKPLRLTFSLLELLQLASSHIDMPPRDICTQLCSPTATSADLLPCLSTAAVEVSHNFFTLLVVPQAFRPSPL